MHVRFRPVGQPLLGVAQDELPGGAACRLARELRRREPREALPRLAEVQPGLLSDAADLARTALLRAGVAALSVRLDRAPAQVRDVAPELVVSERQLRNLFAEGVGVPQAIRPYRPRPYGRPGRTSPDGVPAVTTCQAGPRA
ncbi:hypothetical protein [Streptomyces sp. NPDC054783]